MDELHAQKLWGKLFEHERHIVEYEKKQIEYIREIHRLEAQTVKLRASVHEASSKMGIHQNEVIALRTELANG